MPKIPQGWRQEKKAIQEDAEKIEGFLDSYDGELNN